MMRIVKGLVVLTLLSAGASEAMAERWECECNVIVQDHIMPPDLGIKRIKLPDFKVDYHTRSAVEAAEACKLAAQETHPLDDTNVLINQISNAQVSSARKESKNEKIKGAYARLRSQIENSKSANQATHEYVCSAKQAGESTQQTKTPVRCGKLNEYEITCY